MSPLTEHRYPILVERLDSAMALRIHCQKCSWEADITPEEIRNECDYGCPACGSPADYKYVEADFKCPNCGKLGFTQVDDDHCCSRACSLQWEYGKQLAQQSAQGRGDL